MKKPLALQGKIAALFVDLQEENRQDKRYLIAGFDRVLANVRRLQTAARQAGIPLYHCAYIVDLAENAPPFHPVQPDGRSAFSDKGDPLTGICAEVAPAPGERLLIKSAPSAFAAKSPLIAELRASGIEWLLISGVWTEACITASVKDAIDLGLRVLLVKDACGSATVAMHQTGILNLANRLYGGAILNTDDACRALMGHRVDAWQVTGSVPLQYDFDTASRLYEEL